MTTKAEQLTKDVTDFVATIDLEGVEQGDLNDTITFAVIKQFGLSISRGYSEATAARKALGINARGTGFKSLLEDYIIEGLGEQGAIPLESIERFVAANRNKGEEGSEERAKDLAAYLTYAKTAYTFGKKCYDANKSA